jgi:hypothetical protein
MAEKVTLTFEENKLIEKIGKIYEHLDNDIKLQVMFGYAWGNDINNWKYCKYSKQDLFKQLEVAKMTGVGVIGKDDIWIKISDNIEIQFCHHGDIHVICAKWNEYADEIFDLLSN